MLLRIIAAWLLICCATALPGCSKEDRRPWVICYRVYEQCRLKVHAMSQAQCEAWLKPAPDPALQKLLLCTRERGCPGMDVECFKEITAPPKR